MLGPWTDFGYMQSLCDAVYKFDSQDIAVSTSAALVSFTEGAFATMLGAGGPCTAVLTGAERLLEAISG